MSTLKTVMTTASVLLLGATLLGLGSVAWVEQQEIQVLQSQIASVRLDASQTQAQADSNTARLDKTIKTSNKNFSRLEKRQDKMVDVLSLIFKMVSSSGQEPSAYKNPNARGE